MRRSDVAAGVLMVTLLAAPAAVAVRTAQDDSKVEMCANNLSQMWKMQHNYMVQFGGPWKRMPSETGEQFWLKLSTVGMIDASLREIFQCPVENLDQDECDYRGPNADVETFNDEDPVGADVDGNHDSKGLLRGGNVLRKSGDVQTVSAEEPLWKRAGETTTGGSPANPRPPLSLRAKQKQALVEIGHLVVAVWMYQETTGKFPTSLRRLVDPPNPTQNFGLFEETSPPPGGFLLVDHIPKDPWGHNYQYEVREGHPVIWSWGADGKMGGEDADRDLTMEDVFPTPERKCRIQVHQWAGACESVKICQGDYPPSGNANLVKAIETMVSSWRGTDYNLEYWRLNGTRELVDPWDRPFVYRNNQVDFPKNQNDPNVHKKQTFDFYSAGPNGKDEGGHGDDIGNW